MIIETLLSEILILFIIFHYVCSASCDVEGIYFVSLVIEHFYFNLVLDVQTFLLHIAM